MSLHSQRAARNSVFDEDHEILSLLSSRSPVIGHGSFLDYDDIQALELIRLARDGYVSEMPPDDSDVLFDDQFERRARELQPTPAASAAHAIIPAKKGPWTGNNQLGVEKDFAPASNNEQTILKLDEWDFPQVWSVMLHLVLPEASSAQFSVIAKIRPGVGGATQDIEIDWRSGTTFNVVMNALNIIANYSETTSIPDGVRLGVVIGKRPFNGTRPTRTVLAPVAAGQTEFFRIPKFAKSLFVMPRQTPPNDEFAATTNYRFLSGTSGGTTLGQFIGTQISLLGEIPIPGGANSLRINNGGAGLINPSLIFNLCL